MTAVSRSRPARRAAAAIEELQAALTGEVRADPLSRALYATDASLYQIIPDGVVLPRSTEDVVAAVRACARHGVPLTARGAGTGLTGGAVNRGLQLDCSRHLNRILSIDPDRRIARVQPGVVLDELNAELRPHGLHFAPDVATGSRATIGGMIANNACGAHSIRYGRTVDHLLCVDVVLSDGSTCTWGDAVAKSDNDLASRCEEVLASVARDYAEDIAARYPKVMRCNGGYALDRLHIRNGRVNPQTVICGSEGTLCVVVGATLKLTPLPRHAGLLVAHFDDLLASIEATPAILRYRPAAVELVDKLILDAARTNAAAARRCAVLQGDPQAILMIELYDDDAARLIRRLHVVADALQREARGYAWLVLTDAAEQAAVWDIRKRGLGLLMSRPGDRQPYAFVEDTAVDPARLRDYIERFAALLADEGVEQAGYYAHASVGCLHVRPVLNLTCRDDVERLRRIADRVSSLALAFGGTMTGEHGDGILRSGWLEKIYGPRVIEAFRKIKQVFDPRGLFNPGKIVPPSGAIASNSPPALWSMTENLRYEIRGPRSAGDRHAGPDRHAAPAQTTASHDTVLDFRAHGGVAGMARMCSGVGQCRQRLVGTMCPSYMATGDETHTTRARANALRIALSDSDLLTGLSDPAIDEVMDLCLSCKACKTECPTGVDLAGLKAEWLNGRNRRRGVPWRSRFVAATADLAALAVPCASVCNWVMQSPWARAMMEHVLGLDRRVAPPRFARRTFRQWFAQHRPFGRTCRTDARPDHGSPAMQGSGAAGSAARTTDTAGFAVRTSQAGPTVVYFVDTWTNFFTPRVGIAAVTVLEALGYRVIVPPTQCCGRPAISKGLLAMAGQLAEANAAVLAPYAARSIPIVGTEPSCLLTLVDEFPQLVRTREARQIARSALTIESFIAGVLRDRPDAVRFRMEPGPLLFHGHCHQKSLVGTADAMTVLSMCTGGRASEINSGCCGMAGSFGHEVEHYEVARAIGEQRLFPAVRARGDARIAVSGFSCGRQIEHHTGAEPRHVVEILADALI